MHLTHEQFDRLRQLEADHRSAVYGWRHPANAEWARTRDITGSRSLREWCQHLERTVYELQSEKRQRAAVSDHEPDLAGEGEQRADDEPLVIRRRGEGGKPHAK